jgi:hypothetical protein
MNAKQNTTCAIIMRDFVVFFLSFCSSWIFYITICLCNTVVSYINSCFFQFLPRPILIINCMLCNKSTRPVPAKWWQIGNVCSPWDNNCLRMTNRSSNLLELFMFELETRLPVCSITTKPCYRRLIPTHWVDRACRRPPM